MSTAVGPARHHLKGEDCDMDERVRQMIARELGHGPKSVTANQVV